MRLSAVSSWRLALAFGLGLAFAGDFILAPAEASVLRRANTAEPDSLDPHKAQGTWENHIIGDMLIGLMTLGPKSNRINGAAIRTEISQDGLVYKFKLRPDMIWSDGAPVTAADFVYAYQRELNPKSAAPYASIIYPIKNAQAVNEGKMPVGALGVRALDPKTLEITLERPTPFFLELLTHYTTYPVPRHQVEKYGDAWIKPGNYVSNGPYVLKEWVPNSYVKLVKSKTFYDAASVKIDEITYLPIADSSVVLKRFRAGEIDASNEFPSRQYGDIKAGKVTGILPSEARAVPYVSTVYIQFNTRKKPFDDPLVRRALSLALDRQIIAEKVLGAGRQPAYGLVPPGMANYGAGGAQMDFKTWPMEKRRAEAKALLAQAGFGPNNPLSFTLRYRDTLDNKRLVIAYQGMWAEIGVKAQLLNLEVKVLYAALRAGDFEVSDAAWVADYNDPQNFLFLLQSSSGQMNYGKYSNPKYDQLMDEAARTLDLAKRAELMRQAEAIELTEQPIVPVLFNVSRSLVSRRLHGWQDNVLDWHRTRFMSIDD
jgi:oligopeptide transport system substrate-binding protein